MALSNTSTFFYRFPMSLSLALMTFVGNEMGAKNLKKAKRYSLVGVVLFLGFTLTCMITLSFIKDQWLNFYSAGREEINDIMIEVYPIFVFGFFVIDGLQGTLTGILKGIDRKDFVTYSTLLVYYLIGIPIFLYFSCDFGLGLKVYGIWLSFGLVNALLAILYIILTFTTNWQKMSEKICMRIEKQNVMQNLHDSLNKIAIENHQVGKKKKQKQKLKNNQQNQDDSSPYQQSNYQKLISNQIRLRGSDNEGMQYSLQEPEPSKRQKVIIIDQLTSLS